jgi:uncharacterized protein
VAVRGVTAVLWHDPRTLGADLCRLRPLEDGHELDGIALIPLDDVAVEVRYRVVVDREWLTCRVEVRVESAKGAAELVLESNGAGRWTVDGSRRAELDGCTDVDLGVTPATNTLPIRRLQLGIGETGNVLAAWVAFPELTVVADEQTYERLGANDYRYRSDGFAAELEVDDEGLVLRYGDEYWRAVARR